MTSEIRYLAQQLLHGGLEPLNDRERRIIGLVAKRVHTARDVNKVFDQRLTLGQRLADHVAAVGGSWGFIVGFMVFLAIWVAINAVVLLQPAFDPYPFIFLNLLLSMLAALQAPIMQQGEAAKEHCTGNGIAAEPPSNCRWYFAVRHGPSKDEQAGNSEAGLRVAPKKERARLPPPASAPA
jgi:pimeloyl-ACP methyl ester carboxylesterase